MTRGDKEALRRWRVQQAPDVREAALRAWRATIPFTDEQILLAIRQQRAALPSDDVRALWDRRVQHFLTTKRLSAWLFSTLLPYLVTTCGICGKKALYRSHLLGLCRTHRYIKSEAEVKRLRLLQVRHAHLSRERQVREAAEKKRNAHHTTSVAKAGPRRRRDRRS